MREAAVNSLADGHAQSDFHLAAERWCDHARSRPGGIERRLRWLKEAAEERERLEVMRQVEQVEQEQAAPAAGIPITDEIVDSFLADPENLKPPASGRLTRKDVMDRLVRKFNVKRLTEAHLIRAFPRLSVAITTRRAPRK